MVSDFRNGTPAYNFNQFLQQLPQRMPRDPSKIPGHRFRSLVPGNVTGPIVGGNLTSIINTLGTQYEIDTREKFFSWKMSTRPLTPYTDI